MSSLARSAAGPDPDDPAAGLAQERTVLAWDRSGLAVLVCALVLLRRVWPLDTPERLVGAAAIGVGVAVWATLLVVVARRPPASVARGPGLRRLLAVTLAFAAAAFVLGLVPPG